MRTKTPALGTEREVPAQKAQPHPPTIQYDAFGRRRVRKEYGWSGSAWVLTNEVRYVYNGMLVVQERNGNNLVLVSYTHRKGSEFKVRLASKLRAETTMTLGWIAKRLHMGTRGYLTHLLYRHDQTAPRDSNQGRLWA